MNSSPTIPVSRSSSGSSTEQTAYRQRVAFEGVNGRVPTGRKGRTQPSFETEHYDPLPKKRGAIRLFNLFPNFPNVEQVEGELITPSSHEGNQEEDQGEEISYEALSWYWGGDDETSSVSIKKGTRRYLKSIKPNLLSALRALRDHQNDRFLWIDAIC